jgi:ATP-binding cassette subfamily B multidrug efflux pump
MADEAKLKRAEKHVATEATKKTVQDDDVVGKAYDGRLMRRLLTYLRPYKLQTALSAFAIIFKAGSDVMGPYLVKVAVDTYMSNASAETLTHGNWLAHHLSPNPATGITQLAALYLGTLLLTYALEFLQTYLMQ